MSLRFADASIRRKLTLAMAFTALSALAVVATTLAAYEIVTFRRGLAQRLTSIADIVGRNSTAALTFGDSASVEDLLLSLEAEPGIEAGAMYGPTGRLFAAFPRDPDPVGGVPVGAMPAGVRYEVDRVIVVRPVVYDGEQVGTVYIRSGATELLSRMSVFGLVMLGAVIGSTLFALFISTGLQRWIAGPILGLAKTAQRVTSDRNFSLRADRAGRDEVGELVDDFNRMLSEIEQQDRELRNHRQRLEADVTARTAELRAANEQLTLSMARVEGHAEQIAQLTALGQLLQSCHTEAEVFGVVRHATGKLFPSVSGALAVVNASGTVMEVAVAWGASPPAERVFAPDDCWAFRRGHPHVMSAGDSPLRCAHLKPEDGPVSICVPLIAQGDSLGIIQFNFDDTGEPDAVHETGDVQSTRGRLAVALTEHIALALANMRLREALRNQSIIDPLTGLFNRRYLEQVLERECRRAVRANRPLTVLAIDVDHFKQFNDRWGHDGGDAVLRELGALLKANFRGEDVACRLGGEEFVVLLVDASPEAARQRSENLRLMVHQLRVKHRASTMGAVSISIGLAGLPEHGMTPETLLDAADRAMYEAKKAGRDRIMSAISSAGSRGSSAP
jgi:diguanylate cyclase (GGDEF)-like protein